MWKTVAGLVVTVVLVVTSSGCGSTTPAMPNPITEPVIDQPGREIIRYRDAVIEVVVDTTFASSSLGDPWLILNVGLSGMTGGNTQVRRDFVSVRTPDGRTIGLPPYSEFLAAYDAELASAARRAGLASKPLDFTRANRRPCALNFMPLPGSGQSARTALNVTKNELCFGLLYFPVPGGVQPGNWRLILEFEETDAVVPLTIGEK